MRRMGTCRIVSNDGGGLYHVTQVYWNQNAGSYFDAYHPCGFVNLPARELSGDAGGTVDQVVAFWLQERKGGGPECIILLAGKSGTVFACRTWQDGGTTDGDSSTQCDRTYTARTLDATGPAEGGVLLGSALAPRTRQATSHLGLMQCPPSGGGGWIGLGYVDAGGEFVLFDSGERLATGPCT